MKFTAATTKATLLFLAIAYIPLRSMSPYKPTTSVNARLGALINFFKREDKQANWTKLKQFSRDIELKDSVDHSKLSFCLMPGDIVIQFFKQSDNLTRLKYRRINKVWNQAIQMYADGCIDVSFANGRTMYETLTSAPEKVVFKTPNAQMLTSLMRDGVMQYTGSFNLGHVQGNDAGIKLLGESLKNQHTVILEGRNMSHDFDMPGLINSLVFNTQLTTLLLDHNDLQKNDQDALVTIVQTNRNLKNLAINTQCTPRNGRKLNIDFVKQIISKSARLQTLALYNVAGADDADYQSLLNILADNKTLTKVYVPSEYFQDPCTQLQKEPRIVFDYPPYRKTTY